MLPNVPEAKVLIELPAMDCISRPDLPRWRGRSCVGSCWRRSSGARSTCCWSCRSTRSRSRQNKNKIIVFWHFEINFIPWNTVDSYLSCSFLNFHENLVFDLWIYDNLKSLFIDKTKNSWRCYLVNSVFLFKLRSISFR